MKKHHWRMDARLGADTSWVCGDCGTRVRHQQASGRLVSTDNGKTWTKEPSGAMPPCKETK